MKKITIATILLVIFLVSCAPAERPVSSVDTPTPKETITSIAPVDTPTSEPTPAVGVYQENDIMFTYPPEWQVAELGGQIVVASKQDILKDPFNWTYDKEDTGVVVGVAPLERQANGSPIETLDQYTLFSNIEMPDKELAHMVRLNGKEFAIGTYSESYINSSNGSVPLFIAMYFSKQSTITIEMYASPDEEVQLRKVFEDFLASIETTPTIKTSYVLSPFEPMLFLNADEINGWIEPISNQKVFSDGTCRWFEDENIANRVLTACTVGKSQFSSLTSIREQYSSGSQNTFVDLESMTKYKYDYEFDLYAYQDNDGNPSFFLILENYNLLHSAEIKIQPFQAGVNFSSSVIEQLENEIDDLLHDVMTKILKKSKYPFDPELLISATGLKGWAKPENWINPAFGSDQYQKAYNDGICRSYNHEVNFDYHLDNCIFYKADNYNLKSIKESFQNDYGNKFVDLQTKSKYTYEYDFVSYGYLSDGYPTYTLYLEKDGFLYNAVITILQIQDNADIETISELFNDEIDSTLHEVINKNLENFQ